MTVAQTGQVDATAALAAAEAAVSLLPAGTPLSLGEPTTDPTTIEVTGRAIRARFAGAAEGEVAVVVGQDLVDALADSPMGSLDVTQAVRPALEAAAATLGPVVVDPGDIADPAEILAAVAAAGGVLVPLLDGDTVQAVVALAVSTQIQEGPEADPGGTAVRRPISTGPAGGLELLHDVEMEVTAELGRTSMSVRELLSLVPGAVIELDRAAGGPTDLLVNGRLIARGEVVVIDENFGIRITDIVASGDRS